MDKQNKDMTPWFIVAVLFAIAVLMSVMWTRVSITQKETESLLMHTQDDLKSVVQERDKYIGDGLEVMRCDSKLRAANEALEKCQMDEGPKLYPVGDKKCPEYLVRCLSAVNDFILRANAINAGYELPTKETK